METVGGGNRHFRLPTTRLAIMDLSVLGIAVASKRDAGTLVQYSFFCQKGAKMKCSFRYSETCLLVPNCPSPIQRTAIATWKLNAVAVATKLSVAVMALTVLGALLLLKRYMLGCFPERSRHNVGRAPGVGRCLLFQSAESDG